MLLKTFLELKPNFFPKKRSKSLGELQKSRWTIKIVIFLLGLWMLCSSLTSTCFNLSGRHLCALSLDCYCGGGVGSTKEFLPVQGFCPPAKESFEKALLRRLLHLDALLKVEFWVRRRRELEPGRIPQKIRTEPSCSLCSRRTFEPAIDADEGSGDGKSTWVWFWQKYLVLVCKEKTSAASGEADGLEDASWRSGSRVDIHDEGRFCQRAQSWQRESFHFPVRREGEEERGALVLAPLNRLGDHDRGALWQGVGGNLPLTGQRKRACPALRPNGQDQLVSLGGGHFASVLTSNNSSGHISTCCHDTLKVRPEGGMSL